MHYSTYILPVLLLFLLCPLFSQSPPRQVGAGKPIEVQKIDPYSLSLASLYERGDEIIISLNNGTVWKHLMKTPYSLGWLVGDKIYISARSRQGWVLENSSYKDSVAVNFFQLIKSALPKIKSVSPTGGKIILEDGSEWLITWQNRWNGFSWVWKPENRLIISPLPFTTEVKSHILINLDHSMDYVYALLIRK